MVETMEFVAKDVERAIDTACKTLNVKRDKLRYSIVTEGSAGFLGILGGKKAKIIVMPEGPRLNNTEKETLHTHKAASYQNKIQTTSPKDGQHRKKLTGGLKKDSKHNVTRAAAEEARSFLKKVLDKIEPNSSIDIRIKNKRHIFLNISSKNGGLIIGRNGQTLEALQFIVGRVVSKKNHKGLSIKLDVEGYLVKRKRKLEHSAKKWAKKVKKEQKPHSMGKLPSKDRKTIHIALKNDLLVDTHSTGRGHHRELVIIPTKNKIKSDS